IWNWDNDLVTMVHENLDSIKQRLLASSCRYGFVRRVIGPEISRVAFHDRLAQFGYASHGCVFSKVLLDGGDAGVLDVAWRVEVGFAHAHVAQIDSFRAQLGSLRRHGDRG